MNNNNNSNSIEICSIWCPFSPFTRCSRTNLRRPWWCRHPCTGCPSGTEALPPGSSSCPDSPTSDSDTRGRSTASTQQRYACGVNVESFWDYIKALYKWSVTRKHTIVTVMYCNGTYLSAEWTQTELGREGRLESREVERSREERKGEESIGGEERKSGERVRRGKGKRQRNKTRNELTTRDTQTEQKKGIIKHSPGHWLLSWREPWLSAKQASSSCDRQDISW